MTTDGMCIARLAKFACTEARQSKQWSSNARNEMMLYNLQYKQWRKCSGKKKKAQTLQQRAEGKGDVCSTEPDVDVDRVDDNVTAFRTERWLEIAVVGVRHCAGSSA